MWLNKKQKYHLVLVQQRQKQHSQAQVQHIQKQWCESLTPQVAHHREWLQQARAKSLQWRTLDLLCGGFPRGGNRAFNECQKHSLVWLSSHSTTRITWHFSSWTPRNGRLGLTLCLCPTNRHTLFQEGFKSHRDEDYTIALSVPQTHINTHTRWKEGNKISRPKS